LAKKVLRKRLSARDENRHLDIKREVNFRMFALIDRYWEQYASKKKSQHAVNEVGRGPAHHSHGSRFGVTRGASASLTWRPTAACWPAARCYWRTMADGWVAGWLNKRLGPDRRFA